jgi:hypothetical protein
MIQQIFFGLPGILIFIGSATLAVWLPNYGLMVFALAWSLPSAFYLVTGSGWIQFAALYVPISLGLSIRYIKHEKLLIPRLLLLPIYALYLFFGYSVIAQ